MENVSVPTDRVGFIGLGAIGEPMARQVLQHGHALVVHNRSADKMQALVSEGAVGAGSVRELAAQVDIVLTCVTDGAAMESVVFGPEGVLAARRAGQVVVDLSTIHPLATREMAARLEAAASIRWVDAPVSGGPAGARAGTLAVMAGGRAEDVERVRPVLAAFASQVTHMGPVGCGQATKACNQMINVANAAAISEAMNLASRFGIDPALLPTALAGGFADSGLLRNFGPKIAAGTFAGDTSITLKDLDIVLDLGRRTDSAMPVVGLIASFYRLLYARGHRRDGIAGIARMYAPPGFTREGGGDPRP